MSGRVQGRKGFTLLGCRCFLGCCAEIYVGIFLIHSLWKLFKKCIHIHNTAYVKLNQWFVKLCSFRTQGSRTANAWMNFDEKEIKKSEREKKKMIPERKKEHWALLERLRGLLFAWQGPLSAWLLRRRFLYRSPTTMMFLQRMTSLLLTISSSLASRLSLSLQQFTRLLFLKSNTLADEEKNGLQSLQNTFWACGLNITILNGLSNVFFFWK